MKLIIGLGNIGKEYQKTRHNFGFMVADEIIKSYNFEQIGEKFKSDLFAGNINNHKVLISKPKTFMNLSGESALQIKNFYKISNQNIFVFHDDLDLNFGKIKIKTGGGSAGHNGIKSLDSCIGNDYVRIRLGIGRPENKFIPISEYVLQNFSDEELKFIDEINKKILLSLQQIINKEESGKTSLNLNFNLQ